MKSLIIPAGTETVTVAEMLRLMRSTANEVGIRLYMDGKKVIGRSQGGMVVASELLKHFLEFCRHKNVVPISSISPWCLDYTGLDVQNRMYTITIDEFRMFARPYGIEISCEGMAAINSSASVMPECDEPPELEWGNGTLSTAVLEEGALNASERLRLSRRGALHRTGLRNVVSSVYPKPSGFVEQKTSTRSVCADDRSKSVPAATNCDAELAGLFDSVKVAQLKTMFPDKDKAGRSKWEGWVERADRNGLKAAAKEGRALFNPFRAAIWWLGRGPEGWTLARCYRVLANNLPPRSTDSKHLLTGNYD